ncbi:C2H2-type zinc finger protein [Natronococcus sp. A-GB7]|uniref:C2H2-type zinc finger protein n=1 Tax=Natronococcus sp. A-GB7 TaxID=3037649 RepID=UPI00241D623A|nr:C2H2-type zinc finger protein [Natronococcus sp. A-GB7]MDG5818423.1 C2H2-type zinc finger protein [Natronococcus sp. A-GB7]
MVMDPRDDEDVEESSAFPCPVCQETFDSQQKLAEHGETEHEDTDIGSKQP